ncbi:protein KTI12 homolog isoform X2 [Silurus meridionalis]|uniref:protein KTI12 homolog isoform X2 n=1 Tax=Silurus meridionalis TaxID=175797 RepID=UPI001EEB7EE5|nr:protein KTI12 homolog isoform X2 [Silurus meridionalis]
MPLIIICGFPCSGKSRRANELRHYFAENTDKQVDIIGDEMQSIDKNSMYADSQREKNLRGSLRSEVERKINKDDIVILDSMNYIKGYRYELFCLIKHVQTPHCLVYCLTSAALSAEWNKEREANYQYSQEIMDALILRFEAPDSRNRWDSPLFTVQKEDKLPFEAISDAILKRKVPPPNQSTQSSQKQTTLGQRVDDSFVLLLSLLSECSKPEIDIFTIPYTQTTIENYTYVEIPPLSALTDNRPLDFFMARNGILLVGEETT